MPTDIHLLSQPSDLQTSTSIINRQTYRLPPPLSTLTSTDIHLHSHTYWYQLPLSTLTPTDIHLHSHTHRYQLPLSTLTPTDTHFHSHTHIYQLPLSTLTPTDIHLHSHTHRYQLPLSTLTPTDIHLHSQPPHPQTSISTCTPTDIHLHSQPSHIHLHSQPSHPQTATSTLTPTDIHLHSQPSHPQTSTSTLTPTDPNLPLTTLTITDIPFHSHALTPTGRRPHPPTHTRDSHWGCLCRGKWGCWPACPCPRCPPGRPPPASGGPPTPASRPQTAALWTRPDPAGSQTLYLQSGSPHPARWMSLPWSLWLGIPWLPKCACWGRNARWPRAPEGERKTTTLLWQWKLCVDKSEPIICRRSLSLYKKERERWWFNGHDEFKQMSTQYVKWSILSLSLSYSCTQTNMHIGTKAHTHRHSTHTHRVSLPEIQSTSYSSPSEALVCTPSGGFNSPLSQPQVSTGIHPYSQHPVGPWG